MDDIRVVMLPDGSEVSITDTPQDWWTTPNASGFINPHLLAPDPEQPRQHIDQDELQELRGSVAKVGVRQPIIVTPHALAPWVVLRPEHEHLPFVTVSGHRRTESAIGGNVPAVPIVIRVYKNKAEQLLDASVLNTGHKDLSPFEEGREIVRLHAMGFWTIPELATRFGMSASNASLRINLTKLDPDIQQLVSPTLKEKRRLAITIGGHLGNVKVPTLEELQESYGVFEVFLPTNIPSIGDLPTLDDDGRRFAFQKLLLGVIRGRKMGVVQAIAFIKEQSLQLESAQEGSKKTMRFRPDNRRAIINNLLKELGGTVVLDWTPAEFRRIYAGAEGELALTQKNLDQALQSLTELKRVLTNVQHPAEVKAA